MIDGYTDNYGFPLSAFDTPTWVDEDHSRWRIVDALIAALGDEDVPFVVATGAADAFVATYSPAITAYSLGQVLSFKANNAVTGASTIDVNGLGAKALKINGEDTSVGDIPDDSYVKIIYDGTDFNVIDPKKPVNANRNIIVGSSGATANAATDFYIESSGPTYIEALGPNASTQGYMFSRPAMSYAGGMKYDHVNELLILRVGGNDVWSCTDAGLVTATTFVGAFQGNLTGNASGTAASWATARTLTLGTDASGNVAFDGSANFTLNLTIVANAVTNAKLADMATATFKGRTTAGTGDPEDLTVTQATALLNVFGGDAGSGGLKGLAPATSAGDAAANKFLRASGSWADVFAARGIYTGLTGAAIVETNINCTRNGGGDYSFTFDTPLSSANYHPHVFLEWNELHMPPQVSNKTVNGFDLLTYTYNAGTPIGDDPEQISILVVL